MKQKRGPSAHQRRISRRRVAPGAGKRFPLRGPRRPQAARGWRARLPLLLQQSSTLAFPRVHVGCRIEGLEIAELAPHGLERAESEPHLPVAMWIELPQRMPAWNTVACRLLGSLPAELLRSPMWSVSTEPCSAGRSVVGCASLPDARASPEAAVRCRARLPSPRVRRGPAGGRAVVHGRVAPHQGRRTRWSRLRL